MSSFTIRGINPDEVAAYVRTMFLAAGLPVDDRFVEEQQQTFNLSRAFAAFDGGRLIGTIGTRSLRMTLPGGGALEIAAIGQGGVLPTHTRRGVMRELMMHSLHAAQERGEPLAAWTTSEWPIYGRYGGGPATFSASYVLKDVSRAGLRLAPDAIGGMRLVGPEEALATLPALHARASSAPGGVPRDRTYWSFVLSRLSTGRSLDVLDAQPHLPPAIYAIQTGDDGQVDGFCAYRVHQRWQGALPRSELEVLLFICANTESARMMWHFLLSLDLITFVSFPHRPICEPLRWLLRDGRQLETTGYYDHVWLRIMNPLVAMQTRWFPALRDPLRIRIIDPLRISADLTWEILSDGARTEVQTTNAAADAEMEIGVLSSLLLSGVQVSTLVAAGHIVPTSPSALLRISSAFAPIQLPFTDTNF